MGNSVGAASQPQEALVVLSACLGSGVVKVKTREQSCVSFVFWQHAVAGKGRLSSCSELVLAFAKPAQRRSSGSKVLAGV